MVKHLHLTAKICKLTVLLCVLFLVWGAIWLQSAAHSLNFAKPWILSSLNPENSPYMVQFDELTIDWQHVTELGKLRISHITVSKKSGEVFVRLPEIYATVDFLSIFTGRSLLNTVILPAAHMTLTHKLDDALYIGIEGADAEIALSELMGAVSSGKESETPSKLHLPFKRLRMSDARLTFHDEKRDENILGEPVEFAIDRKRGNYTARLSMPFEYDGGKGALNARLIPDAGANDYWLDLVLSEFPGSFICGAAPCPQKVNIRGKVNGAMRLGLMADGRMTSALAKLSTAHAVLTAPAWFEKPLVLNNSALTATHDVKANTVDVSEVKVELEDSSLSAVVKAARKEDGWHVDAQGKINSPMDVTQLYKYWPLFMAPETREWVTSKLKAGRADAASAHLMLTPEDLAADVISDKALSADVAARDITVDYLPGFPNVQHLNGEVHFTGTTVKIDGSNGSMLGGTKVNKATLWCPDLNNPKIPMEAFIHASLPVSDAVEFLTLKHFVFDDMLTLNKTATGNGTLAMTLKFDSFSGSKNSDPNELHFESVDYDIAANIENFSQSGIAGGYKVKGLGGALKATTKGFSFDGALTLGDSGASDVSIAQPTGSPLSVTVKSKVPQAGKPGNDFNLVYKSGAVPEITLKGKRLDATVSYDASEHSLLRDFPAMKLDVALDELFMTPEMALTSVSALMNCTKQRCESLKMRARTGKGLVAGDILRDGGKRQLLVTASDAGAFLRAFGITDRMTRGKLELRGKYNDAQAPAPFDGRLLISDFTLKNSQILGRIFSIGSLTGLTNALTGSGIAFDKLTANMNANKGLISITEGRANGTAMGMTVAGTVDTSSTKLKLKGVVVPAYALNSMIGKIPLIGALAGGEGEGLIAFNYSVNGTYANPDVMVNPLSGLTPGFLRGIFGIFDAPSGDEAKKTKENKMAAPEHVGAKRP